MSSNDEEYFAAMCEEKFGEDGYLQMALELYQDKPLASSSDEEEDTGVAEADIILELIIIIIISDDHIYD